MAGAAEPPASQLEKDLKELSRVADGYPPRLKTPEERAQAAAIFRSVEAHLVKDLQESPHDFVLELWLGETYRMGHNLDVEGAWDKAVLHLKEAERLKPDMILPPLQLGKLYAASGHPAEAEPQLLQALKVGGSIQARYYLAFTYYQLGQYDKVVAQADEYLKTDPNSELIKTLKERSEAALRGERKPKTFDLQQKKDDTTADPSSFLLYYTKPQPDSLPSLLAGLQEEGALTLGHMTAAGFLSQIFHDNPDRLKQWAPGFWQLGDAARAYVWLSLWFANTPQANAILEDAAHKEKGSAAAESVTKLLKSPSRPLLELPIDSGSSLDLLWGAFYATGVRDYVAKIIDCLPWSLQSGKAEKLKVAIGRAAEWSLRTNAGRDPRVLEICKSELARRDGETRTALSKVILEAPKTAEP
jgi:tetratricopeptide (TPR) repeat protein